MKEVDVSRIIENLHNSNKKTFLMVCSPVNISDNYFSLIKSLILKYSGVILNFKFPSVKDIELLSSKNIDVSKLSFIDGVCVSADELPENKSVRYLMSAKDLEGIPVHLEHFFEDSKPDFLIIDLLDPLLLYNSISQIKSSLEYIIAKASSNKFALFAYVNNENKSLIEKLKPLFEKTLNFCEVKDE